MQTDILAKHPDLPLRVYSVWFNMVWTDSRERWPGSLMTDRRVLHLWDEGKALGRWYSSDGKHIVWDTFLLYPAGAKLDSPPDSLLALGATVIDEREELKAGIEELERGIR